MCTSRFVTTGILLIQLASFVECASAREGTADSLHSRVPLPRYCAERPEPVDPATTKQHRLTCEALRALDRGAIADAIDGLNAAGAVPLHEAPNTGASSYVAVALDLAGELAGAERALDAAFVVLLIESRVVSCDPAEDFTVARSPVIEGIEEAVLAEVGGRMCAPMFAHPDYWKTSPAGAKALAESIEAYEWARRRTGLGRVLPK